MQKKIKSYGNNIFYEKTEMRALCSKSIFRIFGKGWAGFLLFGHF
jgi:hypothetical protein